MIVRRFFPIIKQDMPELLKKFRWPLFFFFLAFFIRLPLLFRMDYANFPEFYRDYYMAERILSGHLPLLGPPSMQANFYFGPVYYYFFAPLFWLFNHHPASLLLTGILLYGFSAAALYKLLLLWFKDKGPAIFGTLFYVVSIYGIQLTSYVSNPNFLPLWVILFFYFLTKILEDKAAALDYFLLGCSYSFAAQLHTTAALVLPLAAIWPLSLKIRHWRQQNLAKTGRLLGFALLGFFLPALPYLYAETASRLANLRSLFTFGAHTLQGKNYLFGLQAILGYFRGALDPFYMSNSYSFIQPTGLYWLVAAGALVIILSVLMAAIKGKISLGKKNFPLSANALHLCLAWFAAASVIILLFNKSPHSHYLIIFWPLPVILLAVVFGLAKQHLGIYKSLIFFALLVSALQIFTFYFKKGTPWQDFYAVYGQNYKNNPATPQIGSPAIGWPQHQR